MHRSALPSGMYSKQVQSKKWCYLDKYFVSEYELDEAYKELYSKHFKKFYNGKHTKRYLKLLHKIEQAKNLTLEDVERLMVLGF